MGIHVIKMPDIGEGIAEVELVAWNVKVGDTVVEDMNLADVMTDKATVEIPSPVHGKVLSLVVDTAAMGIDPADASARLLDAMVTTAPPKDREVEAAKARERAALRYAQ